MTRVEEILVRVRDTLADPNKERWTDPRLIRLVDEAQKQIVLQAKTLRATKVVQIFAGIETLALPDDCYRLLRVTQAGAVDSALPKGTVVQLASFDQMDDTYDTNWEDVEGSVVERVIFDKLQRGKIRLYPIPTEDNLVWTIDADSVVHDQFGIVVAVEDYNVSPIYGVASDFEGATFVNFETGEADWAGVTVYVTGAPASLTIRYLKRPETIIDVLSSLEIDDAYDQAIKFYVTGMALRDDKDVQNRQIGNEELILFRGAMQEAIKDGEKDFVGANTQYEVPYVGGF